ncbi:hypothetical protein EKH77_31315 [Streptomyces luteoverticillatus]|uniref:Uncharacterized protein n=1 Tax=Streptomyces luteoverticillatus TaxID=66425 RepID=A0A3Q9G1B6_STRLT|nr:hypothetical protein EKH77_31315 [Streptomyces luteoverticillatus]
MTPSPATWRSSRPSEHDSTAPSKRSRTCAETRQPGLTCAAGRIEPDALAPGFRRTGHSPVPLLRGVEADSHQARAMETRGARCGSGRRGGRPVSRRGRGGGGRGPVRPRAGSRG